MRTGRRAVLGLLSLLGFFPRLASARRGETEVLDASAYFAPQLAGELLPGTALSLEERAGESYLLLGAHVVGRLPRGIPAAGGRVSRLSVDDDGRTRLFVELA